MRKKASDRTNSKSCLTTEVLLKNFDIFCFQNNLNWLLVSYDWQNLMLCLEASHKWIFSRMSQTGVLSEPTRPLPKGVTQKKLWYANPLDWCETDNQIFNYALGAMRGLIKSQKNKFGRNKRLTQNKSQDGTYRIWKSLHHVKLYQLIDACDLHLHSMKKWDNLTLKWQFKF